MSIRSSIASGSFRDSYRIMHFKCRINRIMLKLQNITSKPAFSLVQPKGASTCQQNHSAFEATRGSQFYRICCVVGRLKYTSTPACPPPCLFGKLASCIIRVHRTFCRCSPALVACAIDPIRHVPSIYVWLAALSGRCKGMGGQTPHVARWDRLCRGNPS